MSSGTTMLDHYNDIGYQLRDDGDLNALIARAADAGASVDSERARYLLWEPGLGIELWVQVNKAGEIIGCMPHFSGRGRMTLEVEELLQEGDVSGFEGILSSRSCPEEDGYEDDISVPVLADLPDFGLLRSSLKCPVTVKAQIAAFAHDVRCFESEDEYEEVQQAELPPPPPGPEPEDLKERAHRGVERLTRAPESYFPGGQSSRPRTSEVGFSGHIRRSELLVNPVTMQAFYHLLVKTYGGIVVDVVANPGIVTGTPARGGILEAECCFSARVIRPR